MNIAVVVPCYRVHSKILGVLEKMPALVNHIICVDDACPDGSAEIIENQTNDPRIVVKRNPHNLGVGGAMITGFKTALQLGADIIVKVDGDGQMNPQKIAQLIKPIVDGKADYVKGNRFFLLENLDGMPRLRMVGNALLSFMNKLSTGYWQIFDPTNGFVAIHSRILALIPLDKIHHGYFFESDMLFRLATIRAVVRDFPQQALYSDENSSLNILKVIPQFLWLHTRNFFKRIFYNYLIRDFQLASIEWLLGPTLLIFGVIHGTLAWLDSAAAQINTPAGTVMLSALPIIIGLQLTLSAIGFDVGNQPSIPLHKLLDQDDTQPN